MKSVFLGALAGAAPFLIFTIALALTSSPQSVVGDLGFLPSVSLALFPLAVATFIVLAASIFVGLPLTFVLRRHDWESETAYVSVGAVVGFLIPIGILLPINATSALWMTVLGAVSGAVTGRTWWISAREPSVGLQLD